MPDSDQPLAVRMNCGSDFMTHLWLLAASRQDLSFYWLWQKCLYEPGARVLSVEVKVLNIVDKQVY